MSPALIIPLARRPSLGRASARRVARSIDLLTLRAAAGGPSLTVFADGLAQGSAGFVVEEARLHAERTFLAENVGVRFVAWLAEQRHHVNCGGSTC